MFLSTCTCMTYKFKNNRCCQKLISLKIKKSFKYEIFFKKKLYFALEPRQFIFKKNVILNIK